MDRQIYLSSLYDYYGVLLTDKQQNYFENYFFDNLTLQEISENEGVSRNAVHKTLKEVEEKLMEYESKLQLLGKRKKLEQIIETVDDETKEKIKEIY